MLGEILGRRAGDARTEVLALFFGPRGAMDGVFLSVMPFTASIRGLADVEFRPFRTLGEGITKNGDLPLTEFSVGVVCPSEVVSILDN